LAHIIREWLDAPILYLDTVDSTNNYAMLRIDADTAQPGMTIVTEAQTAGKGQRGKTWQDVPGESLLTSMIVRPAHTLDQQFIFSAAVAVAIATVIEDLYEAWQVHIKWPNDIIINDKKAGGILIENVLRGNQWLYAVIGLGLNIAQERFDSSLQQATSLRMASGKLFDKKLILKNLREQLFVHIIEAGDPAAILHQYNTYLYRKDQAQLFTDGVTEWSAKVQAVLPNGQLQVLRDTGAQENYTHGVVQWKWI